VIMSITTIRGQQVLNGTIARADLNTSSVGQAVVAKLVQGSNITLSSTGADAGTGDVTISALADPGTWTTPAFATGWSDGGGCAYRVEVVGSVSTVFARGIAAQAAAAASLAFTLASGARPSAARVCQVAGYQNESDSTQSLVLYGVSVDTSGNVNITPIIKNNAVWTSSAQSQSVYLDSLTFSL
jgi:hypothetical protein